MLARNPVSQAKRHAQRANQQRYRRRLVYGQLVPRVTINPYVIDMLVAEHYLANNVVHDRQQIESALTRFIDDKARQNQR